jgi:hypothetical protein
MVSKNKKGNKVEIEVENILKLQDYAVMRSPRIFTHIGYHKYISKDNDYFNLFDIVAKKSGYCRWIQIKSNACNVSRVKKPIANFADSYGTKICDTFEIWLRVKRMGFVVYEYNMYGSIWLKSYLNIQGEECDDFNILQGGRK